MITLTAAAAALALSLGQTTTLTLDEALQRADQANLDLKAAQAKVAQAKAGIWKAWSYHLPNVSVGASWTHNRDEVILPFPETYAVVGTNSATYTPPPGSSLTATNMLAIPATFQDIVLQKHDVYGAQVQATLPLLAPQLWYTIESAYRGAGVAEKSVEAARREILFGVTQAYYGTASLKRLVEVSNQLLEIARRQEKDAEVRYKAGTIAKVGLLRAQIDRARAEQDLLRSKNSYESVRLSLAMLLDRPPDFEVADPADPTLPQDLGGLERSALQDRPDVQAARLSEDLAGSLRKASAMKYLPAVGAFARYQISNVAGFTGKEDSWAVGLGLTWNVFDGGLREAELREGGARIAEAEASRRSAEAKATMEVKQALLDLESARANASKAREQRELAAENQRLVDVSFKAGAATAVEQADATAALRTAEIAYVTESLAAQLAAVRVQKAAGSFDPARAH